MFAEVPVVVPVKVQFKAPEVGVIVEQGLYRRKWRWLALVGVRKVLVVEYYLLKVSEAQGGDPFNVRGGDC